MRKYAMQHYGLMKIDLAVCEEKAFDEEKNIECCYEVCTHYWRQLQHALAIYHFKNEEEEVDFFKNIKPLFTSEIEYYNLLYHAQLFMPLFGYDDQHRFWLRESLRLEKFTENHIEFYNYYKNKSDVLDAIYFLRINNEIVDIPEAGITPIERKTATSHDHLMAYFMALEKYTDYVRLQIDKLNYKQNGN